MASLLLPATALIAPLPAHAAPPLHIEARWGQAYDDHPLVRETRSAGALGLLSRERAFDEGLPLDRALAVIDAVGSANARRHGLADALVRALRARHSVGPSGAMLAASFPLETLSAREALLLGWARALHDASNGNALRQRAGTLEGAGGLELLEFAAAKAADRQTPALALALLRASLAGTKGPAACAAWIEVQEQARDGRRESVRAAVASQAIAAVLRLGAACPKARRASFRGPPSLPPPAAEVVATKREPRERPRSDAAQGTMRQSGAFALRAPVFKGYLADPTVALLARGARLDEVLLAEVLARDPTGDLSLAALNVALLMRRVASDDILEITFATLARAHGKIDDVAGARASLPLAALRPAEAMALAYARALADVPSARAPPTANGGVNTALLAHDAAPADLFAVGRQRAPGNAALGPALAMAHDVDRERLADPCGAARRAEALAFVLGKSALPPPTQAALAEAMATVRAACGQPTAPAAGR